MQGTSQKRHEEAHKQYSSRDRRRTSCCKLAIHSSRGVSRSHSSKSRVASTHHRGNATGTGARSITGRPSRARLADALDTSSVQYPPPPTGGGPAGDPGTSAPGLITPQAVIEDITSIEVLVGAFIVYLFYTRWKNYFGGGANPIQLDPTQPPITCPPWTNPPQSGPLPAFQSSLGPSVQPPFVTPAFDVTGVSKMTNITSRGWIDSRSSTVWTNEMQVTLQTTTGLKQSPWANAAQLTVWQSAGGGAMLLIKDGALHPIWTNYASMTSGGGVRFGTPINLGTGLHTFMRGACLR